MQSDELMSLKETGQKGDFLLPYEVSKTIMPDYYTTFPMHWHDEMEIVFVEQGEYIESVISYLSILPCFIHFGSLKTNERCFVPLSLICAC